MVSAFMLWLHDLLYTMLDIAYVIIHVLTYLNME